MNKFRVKTLLNYIINLKTCKSNINKYEEKCTHIFIFNNNCDDDDLHIQSIREQIYKEKQYKKEYKKEYMKEYKINQKIDKYYKKNSINNININNKINSNSVKCTSCIDSKCYCIYK